MDYYTETDALLISNLSLPDSLETLRLAVSERNTMLVLRLCEHCEEKGADPKVLKGIVSLMGPFAREDSWRIFLTWAGGKESEVQIRLLEWTALCYFKREDPVRLSQVNELLLQKGRLPEAAHQTYLESVTGPREGEKRPFRPGELEVDAIEAYVANALASSETIRLSPLCEGYQKLLDAGKARSVSIFGQSPCAVSHSLDPDLLAILSRANYLEGRYQESFQYFKDLKLFFGEEEGGLGPHWQFVRDHQDLSAEAFRCMFLPKDERRKAQRKLLQHVISTDLPGLAKVLKNSFEKDPDFFCDIVKALGPCLYSENRFEIVPSVFQPYLRNLPPKVAIDVADLHRKAKRYRLAILICNRFLEKHGSTPELRNQRDHAKVVKLHCQLHYNSRQFGRDAPKVRIQPESHYYRRFLCILVYGGVAGKTRSSAEKVAEVLARARYISQIKADIQHALEILDTKHPGLLSELGIRNRKDAQIAPPSS